jgi:hypothetical protein
VFDCGTGSLCRKLLLFEQPSSNLTIR